MRNPSKILGLALAALLSCTAAMAADQPAKKPLQEGWDRKQIKVFAYACTEGLLNPAVRDFNAAALADGITAPRAFPEREFRESAFPMCLCISERVAETWTVKEMEKPGLNLARSMIDEALNGGRCKPAGLLGDILKKRKEAAK